MKFSVMRGKGKFHGFSLALGNIEREVRKIEYDRFETPLVG